MTQVIETYPSLMNAYVTMVSCNGGLNRDRPLEVVLRASDPVIGADGVDHETLVTMDRWLATLSEDQVVTLVDGEDTEIATLLADFRLGDELDGLLNDLFEA